MDTSGVSAHVPAADEPHARRVLSSLTQLRREIVELDYTQRLDATERVREALRRLGDAGSPAELLERAAAELGACTDADLVLVSRVRGELLVPLAAWRREQLAAPRPPAPTALEPGLAESAVAARPAAVLVEVASGGGPRRAAPTLAEALGWSSYVVAPITLRGQVVGMLHAGVRPGTRPLAEFDRGLVALFAGELTGVLERSVLEHTLKRHRADLAAATRFLERRLGASAPRPAARPPAAVAGASDPLTARELEVLRLLAEGHTNRSLAERLAISEGTVKYHVKNILRKLRASSRADAVASSTRRARSAPSGPA